MLDILKVIGMSLGSAIVLFLLTKLMGNKQISQLTMFDYVIGITIGSIAAEMSTELEKPLHSVTALVVYGVLAFIISVVVQRSIKARKVIDGRAIVLLDNGKLYRENCKKARLDLNEFLTLCRIEGYFDLRQVQTAVMEYTGKISFLPVSQNRPATPADLGQSPTQEKLMAALVLDGHVQHENLQRTGKDEIWLKRQLSAQGYPDETQVFLAMCDDQNALIAFPMHNPSAPQDAFQ